MAAGYLGKISAIVSANTGDFSSKLNGSAKEVRKFASTVESTIGSASRNAASSLANIYTPLQKLERAIQAASTMKLAFSGFAGAIKDVDVLKQRLTSLNQKQIDIILKTSGLKDISMFRDALSGLRSQDYNLLVKVGGADKLKSLREQIAAGGGEFGILAQTKEASNKVDELRRRIDEAKKAGAEITVGVDASEVKAATAELNRFVAEAAKSMGVAAKGPPQRVAAKLRGTLIEGLAGDEAELARRQAIAGDRDRALSAPKLTPRQRRNITERYPSDLDEKIAASQAAIESKSGMLKELDAKQAAVATASAGRTAVAVAPADNIKGLEAEYDAATKSRQKLMAEARKTISTAVGFEVDDSAIEKLSSGKLDMFDNAIKQGEILDAVFKQAGVEGAAALERLAKVMDKLGIADLESTRTKIRQIVSASEQINKPLGDMQKRLSGASYDTQAAFLPALKRAQAMAESLNDTIRRGVTPAKEVEAQFAAVESRVRKTKSAMDVLLAAEAKAGKVGTGEEIEFRSPAVNAALARSQQINAKAMSLSAESIVANPAVARDAAQVFSLSQRVTRELGTLLRRQVLGLDTTQSEANLARTLRSLTDLQDAAEKRIDVIVDTDSAEAALRRLKKQEELATKRELADRELAAGLPTTVTGRNGESRDIASTFVPLGTVQARAVDANEKRRRQFEDDLFSPTRVTAKTGEVREFTSSFFSADDLMGQAGTLRPPAADPRVSSINDAWDMAVRGVPTKPEQVDQQFNSLMGRVQRFDLSDRLDLDPLIADFRNSVAAGEPLISQFQRLLALGQAVDAVDFRVSLGGDIMSSERQIGVLKSSIVSVKGQLEQLPAPVRARFLPALMDAEKEINRLNDAGDGTAEKFAEVAASLRSIAGGAKDASTAINFRDRFGRGVEGVTSGLDQVAVRGYEAQLLILQQTLARVSADARGPGVAAFNALAEAIENAMTAGTLGTPAVQQEIQQLTNTAVGAIGGAQGSGTTAKGLGATVKRAGDVSRMGVDKWSLALNQAAFAVDDFMSSTGGLEFKLRAISNNITQLAFVLGGTTGLFIGLGTVIGGQVAVALLKWFNNGRTAEDQTKALNDALARQKSLAEELAQAFGSLGDSLSRGLFSGAADEGRQFAKSLDDIRKKQQEQQRESVAGVNPEVLKERAQQSAIKRQIETQTDVGQILNLQRQLRESQEREKAAADSAVARQSPTPADVGTSLRASFGVMADAMAMDSPDEESARAVREDLARRQSEFVAPTDIRQAREAIKARQAELGALADGGTLSQNSTAAARGEIARLQGVLALLEAPARKAADALAVEVARSAEDAAASIRSAQDDVADAIRRGVPAAGEFQGELNRLAAEMDAAMKSLAQAQGADVPADQKERMVASAKARVDAARGDRDAVEARAREARLGRSFGGERTRSVLSALEGNQFMENEQPGIIARTRRRLDDELVGRRRFAEASSRESAAMSDVTAAQAAVDNAVAQGRDPAEQQKALGVAQAKLEEARAAREAADSAMQFASQMSDLLESVAQFALSLEAALARTRQIGDSALRQSEGGADAAQRRVIEGAGGAADRDAAERQLLDDRERVGKAQNALSRSRAEATDSPQMEAIRRERKAVRSQLEGMAADGGVGPANYSEQERLRNRLVELERQEAVEIQRMTDARRKELDAIARGVNAREKELEKARARDAENPNLTRDRRNIDAFIGEAERRAQEAQDRFAASPTPENLKKKNQAEEELAASRKRQQELEDNLATAEREFGARDDVKKKQEEIDRRERRKAEIIGNAAGEGRALTGNEKDTIADIESQNRDARAEIEAEKRIVTAPERSAIEEERRRQEQRRRAERGRELGMSDRARRFKELSEGGLADISAAANEMNNDNPEVKRDFLGQAFRNLRKEVAPAIDALVVEQEQAIALGPRKAAMQFSDITSSQGQAELNRLLRGQDDAQERNIVELQKQTDILRDIGRKLEQDTNVTLDL